MDRGPEDIRRESRRLLRNAQRHREVNARRMERVYSGMDELRERLGEQGKLGRARDSRSGD